MPAEIFSLLTTLLVVLVVVLLAYLFTRYVAGRTGAGGFPRQGQGGERLRVLAQLYIGKDQRLLVVQAGTRYFLLSATGSEVRGVAELSEEEAADWLRSDALSAAPPRFAETFRSVFERKKQG